MASERSDPAPDERRRDVRRAVAYRVTLQIGVTNLSGTAVDLSRGGVCVLFLKPADEQVGTWGVLTGEGPFGMGFGARLAGISGRGWHIAFDPAPLWGDDSEPGVVPPEFLPSDILRARARLWRGLVDVQDQAAGRAMTATAADLEAQAERLRAAASESTTTGPDTPSARFGVPVPIRK